MKNISDQKEWQRVAEELEAERLKLASYDKTLLAQLGIIDGKHILDYGCGPGVLASALHRLGADVRAFDISPEMRRLCGEKIGHENVHISESEIPEKYFDHVICNLVMCIVPEEIVELIARNIMRVLKANGVAFIGFCNPEIFDVPESALDFRFPTGNRYEENHSYRKLKKEGCYEITEFHRPIKWYEQTFRSAGLNLAGTLFTPEYELNGRKIRNFVIFALTKN